MFKALRTIQLHNGNNLTEEDCLNEIKKRIKGYHTLSVSVLKRAQKLYEDPERVLAIESGKAIKPGRRVNKEFEDEVINSVIFRAISLNAESLEQDAARPKEQRKYVLANICYSYDIIRSVAKTLHKSAKYMDDPKVRDLKFTNKWVKGLLKRYELTKRRCTTTLKNKPTEAEVRMKMQAIQTFITENNLTPDRVFNEDETGIRWCTPLLHQYVPKDADRASSLCDDSGRFTAMLGANGDGKMIPLYIILKSSVKSNFDLTSSTILKKLHEGSTTKGVHTPAILPAEKGWVLKQFVCQIKDKKQVPQTYKRPFLFNTETLHVVTVQNKAWNDAVGMMLHIREQLAPYKQKYFPNEKVLMVVDNVATHHVPEVQQEFLKDSWTVMYLPPNMTSELQPMDLAVNATCKAAMRRLRIDGALQYMRRYQAIYNSCLREKKTVPEFRPQNPTYSDGVITMLNMMEKEFQNEDFIKGVKKSFQNACILPKADGTFSKYVVKCLGSVKSEDLSVVGTILQLDTRAEASVYERSRTVTKGNDEQENQQQSTIQGDDNLDLFEVEHCEFFSPDEVFEALSDEKLAGVLGFIEEPLTDSDADSDLDDDENDCKSPTDAISRSDDADHANVAPKAASFLSTRIDKSSDDISGPTENVEHGQLNSEDIIVAATNNSSFPAETSNNVDGGNVLSSNGFKSGDENETALVSSNTSEIVHHSKLTTKKRSVLQVYSGNESSDQPKSRRGSRATASNYEPAPGEGIPCSCGCGLTYTSGMVRCSSCKIVRVRTLCSPRYKCKNCLIDVEEVTDDD
jgi:hypothetical protein